MVLDDAFGWAAKKCIIGDGADDDALSEAANVVPARPVTVACVECVDGGVVLDRVARKPDPREAPSRV